ncbi:MAG: S41 family peptidase [Planctomycetota bacterium]
MSRRQFFVLIIPLLAVMVALAGLYIAGPDEAGDQVYWDPKVWRAMRLALDREFVWGVRDEKQAQEAFYIAANRYLQHFDRHAEVVPPWLLEEQKDETQGRYAGVGFITLDANRVGRIEALHVNGVCPDGPADRAGVREGDDIISVDGVSLGELTAEDGPSGALVRIRGPIDTNVRVGVRRADETLDIEITRGHVPHGSVFGKRMVDADAGIGYLRLGGFHAATAEDFRTRLRALIDAGAKALVLDLRGNKGGMLDAAIGVADALIESGIIVQVQYRNGLEVHTATPETEAPDLPLAVLINAGSASASEVLAGALQDHARGVLIGEHSYGKFAVQTMREIPSSEKQMALLKITTALYRTPSGRYFQRHSPPGDPDPLAGLIPDLRVPQSRDDRQILASIFDAERYADWKKTPEVPFPDFQDRVLMAAIAVLKGEVVRPEIQ